MKQITENFAKSCMGMKVTRFNTLNPNARTTVMIIKAKPTVSKE